MAYDGPKIAVTVGMRANLGNYESADCSVCLSGIEPGMPEESIEEMLDTGKVMFKVIARRLREKLLEMREVKRAGN